MFVKLSEYYYTNKFIPISTDSTILKIVKVSGIVFFGLFAFLFDCGLKLLADRNIKQQKEDLLDLAAFLKNTLGSIESTQDMQAIVEQIPTEALVDKLKLVESRPTSTETPDALPVSEQVSTKMPVDKYSVSLLVQKKTLERYLLENFQVTSQDFLKNLQQFVAGGSIDGFVPSFGKSPFPIHEHLVKVIERLLKEDSSNEPSKDYEEYTRALRKIIGTTEYRDNKFSNSICILTQKLCYSKFMEVVLTDLQENTLKSTIRFDSSRNIASSNISELIKGGNKILHKQSKGIRQSISLNYEKACNAAGFNSDQLSRANIPELRSVHKVSQAAEAFDIYYIRYPTPTIETAQSFFVRIIGKNATAIAPEFIGFLDSIQRKKNPFLYVNHQHMDKKDNRFSPFLSADNNRAEAIQKLEETHAEVFHFLSLPFDGPVVSEISKENLESWKENLVNNVIREKDGFKIPKKFRKSAESKKKEIKQLLNELHRLYFSEKQELNKSELNEIERRVLLVIFYSYLKEYFKSEYQIRIMASVCKDNKDRGNMSACIDEALFNLRLGKENDQQALKDLHLRALSPFIFREEGIVPDRLQFLTDLLDHIAELDGDQKEKIRAFKVNKQYQIIDQWIPRSNDDIMI